MKITLGERTIDHVRIYFEKTQNDTIHRMLPSDVTCIEQTIANFEQSLLPDATSYGRTVCCDGQYIVLLYQPTRNTKCHAQLLYL